MAELCLGAEEASRHSFPRLHRREEDCLIARTLSCDVGIGPDITCEALVASDNFSARYGLDRIKGVFSRPQHALANKSYHDKTLVVNAVFR